MGLYFEKVYYALRTLGNLRSFKTVTMTELLKNSKTRKFIEKSFLLLGKLLWIGLQDVYNGDSSNFKGILEKTHFSEYDWISFTKNKVANKKFVLKRYLPGN